MAKTPVALVAVLVLAGCQSSPEGDLKKLGRAVREGDSAEAVRYLDVDRTTSSLVSEFMSLALRDAGKGDRSDPASQLGSEMGEEMIRMMQPAIEGMVKQGVYDVISGRPVRVPAAIAKSQADTVSRDSILQLEPRILRTRSFSDSAFSTVEIRYRARTETLVVKMEHADNDWRVVRLDGLESLLDSTRE